MQSTVDIDKYNNVYVTSDWHLSHKNILKYDKNRNFESLDEMNEYIISTVEATLQEWDLLIFLWDLTMGNINNVDVMMDRLSHFDKIWLLWNHDSKDAIKKLSKHFILVLDTLIIDDRMHLNHFPPLDYQNNVNYQVDKYEKYCHWHTHKPQKHWYWYDVSYDWRKLLYNLNELI